LTRPFGPKASGSLKSERGFASEDESSLKPWTAPGKVRVPIRPGTTADQRERFLLRLSGLSWLYPKLAARVRLLASGAVNKNDPNDARPVAIAALRSPSCLPVRPDDHAAVLKIWAKRHRDLSRTRNQVACRLHAALCELVPGGVSKEIYAAHAAAILEETEPCGAVAQARAELAAELVAGLRHVGALLRETNKKLAVAVRASGTSLTEIFGDRPGHRRDRDR
jgi:hypothetical protein